MKRLFKVWIVVILALGVVGCGGGGQNRSRDISGIVAIGKPVQNATVEFYKSDGASLNKTATTDTNGKYAVHLSDNSDILVARVHSGVMDGQKIEGDLFAVCKSSQCNITPLSTIAYAYFNSLINGDDSEKYKHTEADLSHLLGVSKQELNRPGQFQHFNLQNYLNTAQKFGFDVLNAKLLTDISDGFLDKNREIFPDARERTAQPLPQHYEALKDENKEPIVLNIEGVDGSQTTKGYLVDTVATRKIMVFDDDFQEKEETEAVFLSFNVGKWKGELTSETTVLAKLFMSDLDMLLLPNSAKIELVEELKSKYKESYEKTIDTYKFVVINGKFYEPLFAKQLDLLVGSAQKILLHVNRSKQIRSRALQKSIMFSDMYKKEQRSKLLRDYTLNANLSIDYDNAKHSFTIKNSLPVYYALRPSKPEYGTAEQFASPLVAPSELGAAGLLIKDIDWLTSVTKYITNKDAIKTTTLEGDQFDTQIFPYVGATPTDGRWEYQFYKEFDVNMPTIMNVSLGIKAVLNLVAGTAGGKFEEVMNNIFDRAQNAKKFLTTLEDGLDLAESLTEMLSVSMESGLNNNILTDNDIVSVRPQLNFVRNMQQDIKTSRYLIKSIKNIIPPAPVNTVLKDKAGYFLTKIHIGEKDKPLENSAVMKVLNLRRSGELLNKEALEIIVLGNIVGKILNTFTIDSLAKTEEQKKFKESINEFKKTYMVDLIDFSMLMTYDEIVNEPKKSLDFVKAISGLTYIDNSMLTLAKRDFMKLFLKTMIKNSNFWQDIIGNNIEIFMKPVSIAKLFVKVERMFANNANNILTTAQDFIVKSAGKIVDNAFKTLISSAVKQVVYSLTGSKIVQAAGAANDLLGIGYGMMATPSVVPFAVKVDNGKVSFDYPSIKVIAAENRIVPLGGSLGGNDKLTSMIQNEMNNGNYYNAEVKIPPEFNSYLFMFQSQKEKDQSLLIVTSQDENQAFYDLSYRILFNNSPSNLKGLYKRWSSNNVITAHLSLRRYPNDDLSREPITFGSSANEATWTVSSDEALDAIETFQGGSVIDIIDVLKKQNATGLNWLFGLSDDSSTIVQNRTRGIFNEKFSYKIFEPDSSKLSGKETEIKYFDRNVFKVENAKEMRKKLVLFKWDNTYNAITNLTGHTVTITGWSFEQQLENGATIKIRKGDHMRIVDGIVTQFGRNTGFKTADATIEYLTNKKSVNYVVSAADALQSQSYQFIISLQDSDFVDQKPVLHDDPVNSGDYDRDGLSDYTELHETYTNPYSADSDGDGLNDWEEINTYETQPYNADSDGDGLNDWQEINVFHYDPNNRDSDGDGVDDLTDIITIVNPVVEKNSISGKVTDKNGDTLPNITVKFEYIQNGQNVEETDVTGADGSYRIQLLKEDFDNIKDGSKVVISAFADGYIPKIEEMEKNGQENFTVDFVLEPKKENEIVLEIEPHLHHLGDGQYTGSVNSEFQRAGAEGTEFVKTFMIDANQFRNYQRAEISFKIKGVEKYNNILSINNSSYTLKSSPYDGSYEVQTYTVKKADYHEGENVIKISSPVEDIGNRLDYDDFEFINVKITFLDPVSNSNQTIQELLGKNFISITYTEDGSQAIVVRRGDHGVRYLDMYDLFNTPVYKYTIATINDAEFTNIFTLPEGKLLYIVVDGQAPRGYAKLYTYDYKKRENIGGTTLYKFNAPSSSMYLSYHGDAIYSNVDVLYYIDITDLEHPKENPYL